MCEAIVCVWYYMVVEIGVGEQAAAVYVYSGGWDCWSARRKTASTKCRNQPNESKMKSKGP